MRSPSLPNRTGGSPASGFPVSGCSFEKEHAFRAVPKDAGQTFGSTQANGTRLVPPPVSPRGHSRWFVFRHSVFHPSTFLRSLRSTVITRFSATTDALTPAVAALRPAGGMNTVFGPPPVSLIMSLGLPTIPSPTINARPAAPTESSPRCPPAREDVGNGLVVLVPLLSTARCRDAVTVRYHTVLHPVRADLHRSNPAPSQAHLRRLPACRFCGHLDPSFWNDEAIEDWAAASIDTTTGWPRPTVSCDLPRLG